MADISHHQFVALLKKSKVVDPKKLQPWLEKTKKIENARKLAKSLVQQKLLTTWQAKFLLSGRYRLRIGNYFLLSRLRRDELGARYLAVHSSLKRKVELQIFARELTSDTQRWKDMIQKASLVAKLDHPALVHVYDIDHDDDRYFLVVEHVAGRALDIQKEIFTTPQIGKLVLQCAEGIEVAHQNNVVHGTIDQSDILLTDKGTVKLQNLTVSPMRNLNSEAPEAEPGDDYVAMAVLGEKILQANPGADAGAGIGLSAVFELMKSDGPRAIRKLKQWVAVTPDGAAVSDEVTKSGASPIFSPTPESSSGVDLSKTPSTSVNVGGEGDDGAAATSSASIVEAAKSSRPFLIAVGIGALMFCGIMIFGLSRAYHNLVVEPAAVATADKEEAEAKKKAAYNAKEQKAFDDREAKNKLAGDPAKRPEGPKKRRNPAANNQGQSKGQSEGEVMKKADAMEPKSGDGGKAKVEEAKPSEAKLVETPPENPKPAADKPSDAELVTAEPEAKPSKFKDIFGKGSTQTSGGPDGKTAAASKPANKNGIPPIITDPDNLTKLNGIGPATARALSAVGVRTYDQIVKMTPVLLDKAVVKGGGQKLGANQWAAIITEAKPLAEVALSKHANPFRKVPSVFQLPPVDDSNPVKLTTLLIPANYSLTAELVSSEGIAPRAVFFELNKQSSGDGQAWTVLSKRSQTSPKSTPVATFTKTFDALSFAWLPEAAKERTAVYLRNCFLRLSTPDGLSSVSKLRKPTKVRSLRITKDNLFDTVKFQIEGAPHSDQLQIQLGPLQNRERTIEVVDPLCTFKSPAVVALKRRETKGQFLALLVSVQRSSGAIKLSAGLSFNGKMLKSASDLSTLQNQLTGFAAVAKQRLQTKPSDRELQSKAIAAIGNLNRMNDYMKSLEWLFEGDGGIGQPINFDVTADFGDGRIMFLKSDKNLVGKNKKKKK